MVIEVAKQEVRKLLELLEEPHPGLLTWNSMVADQFKTLNKMYEGARKRELKSAASIQRNDRGG